MQDAYAELKKVNSTYSANTANKTIESLTNTPTTAPSPATAKPVLTKTSTVKKFLSSTNTAVSFLTKNPSLKPGQTFLNSSFLFKNDPILRNKRKADQMAHSLEDFLESVDMSAYYNLITSRGIANLEDLLNCNRKVDLDLD